MLKDSMLRTAGSNLEYKLYKAPHTFSMNYTTPDEYNLYKREKGVIDHIHHLFYVFYISDFIMDWVVTSLELLQFQLY
jgi:hypothetical protein